MGGLARVGKILLLLIAVLLLLLVGFAAVLKMTDWSEHKGLVISAIERFSDWEVERLGDIEIDLFFPTEIRLKDFSFTQSSPESAVSRITAGSFEVSLDPLSPVFDEQLIIHDIQLAGAEIVAKPAEDTADEEDSSEEESSTETGLPQLPLIETASIRDSSIVYQRSASDQSDEPAGEDLNLYIEDVTLSTASADAAASEQAEPQTEPREAADSEPQPGQLTVSGKGRVNDLDWTIEGSSGPLSELADDASLPVDIQGTLGGDSLSVTGTAADLNLSVEGNSLTQIAQLLGIRLSNAPAYELSFSSQYDNDKFTMADIQMSIGESAMAGEASVDLAGEKPNLFVDLTIPMLRQQDLEALIPDAAAEEIAETTAETVAETTAEGDPSIAAAPPQDDPEQPPEEPPSLDFLESLNADVSVVLEAYEGEALGPVNAGSLNAKLADGKLDFNVQARARELTVNLEGALGSLQKSPEAETLPFNLSVTAAGDSLTSEGQLKTTPEGLTFTATTTAGGNNLTQLAGLFDVALPNAPAYDLSFEVSQIEGGATLSDLKLTLGESYLYGGATLQLDRERPYLAMDLGVSLLRQQDLDGLIPGDGSQAGDEPEADEESAQTQLFSSEPLNLDFLHQMDADVDFALAEYEGGPIGALVSGLQLIAKLDNGILTVDPLNLALAGGTIEGSARVDDREGPPEMALELSSESLQLADMISPFADIQQSNLEIRGVLGANVDVSTQGETPDELAGQLNGRFGFLIHDGVLPAVLLEALGLDITEAAVSWFSESPVSDINCAVGRFEIDSGLITTDALLLSTDDSNITGDGKINLAEETIDYELEAHAKDFSVLASDSPIHITGELTNIQIDVVSGELVATLGASALLALVNPLLAVIPFTELGTAEMDKCSDLRETLETVNAENKG